jgi:hypothetical protein
MNFRRRWLLALVSLTCLAVCLVLLGVARYYQEPDNYSLIEPGLYMGGDVAKPPGGTHAVLNLCEKPDPYERPVHLWEPIRDAEPAPEVAWLRRMVEFVDTQRRKGRTTYVHCFNGVSRSGLVVVAYLMFAHDWTRDEALEFVRQKRPITRPNPAFMRLLLEWERFLHEKASVDPWSWTNLLV